MLGLAGVVLAMGAVGYGQQGAAAFVNTLMPQPAQMEVAAGTLALTQGFTVSSNAGGSLILQAAVRRALEQMELRTNLPLRGAVVASGGTLNIVVADATGVRPVLETDESYTLKVSGAGIVLEAKTVFGAMHGLETLQQLLEVRDGAWVFPEVSVADSPRFPWRGLMLDVSRHFMPLPVLYRTVDAMAAVKMNVLHLHLTDDQGVRIESKRFPALTKTGSDGLFYTQEQMRELVEYASAHGIRVVPEFDVPGHVTSWLVGMPELGSVARKYEIARTFGIWDGALDPTRESTYKFLDGFIEEMAGLFPDEYMHLGGDESNGKDWKANPAIVAFMQQHKIQTTDELQVYFSTRVSALVKKHHKQMVGWDEILQPDTPKDAVIQSWRGASSIATAAMQGNRSILSAPYYLDAMKSAEQMYLDDPIPDGTKLSVDQQRLILGGEVTMWAEQITPQTIESRLWPRTAALAERFWSPKSVRDVDDLYRRLAVESIRLDGLGITHISGPERGLRQIAGSEEGAAQLGVLTSVLTPASFSDRYQQQKTSQLTPMGNVVDFTRPDPAARQDFRLLVDRYLHATDKADHELARLQLEGLFQSWIETRPALDELARSHPLVDGVKVRREQLPELGLLGVQSLGYIEGHSSPDAAWVKTQTELLKTAAEHREIVDFVVLPSLQRLVDATSPH
jgi:hexosaminidase